MKPEKYRPLHADSVRAAQQGEPEAIMAWVRLPNGRVRLYASRKLHDIAWGQRTREDDLAVVWHLDGNLDQVLIVDRDTAAEALMWVLERWAREDAAEAQALEKVRGPAELPWGRPDADPAGDIRATGR